MSPVFWGGLTAVGFGTSSFIARLSGRAVGSLPTLTANFTVSVVILSLWFAFTDEIFRWDWSGVHWLLGTAVGFTVGSLWLYVAIVRGPVSVAMPLIQTYAVFVLIGTLLMGIIPAPIQWAGMATVLIGTLIVIRGGRLAASAEPGGIGGLRLTVAIAVIAAMVLAGGILTGREASAIYGPIQTIFIARALGLSLLSFLVLLAWLRGKSDIRFPLRWWPAFLVIGILDTGAVLSIVIGTQGEGAALAAVASTPSLVITVLLAWTILREPIPLFQWMGIALVVVGIGTLAYTS